MTQRTSPQQGFSLIIIAALFVAFSVVAAVIIDRNNATQQMTREVRTREQMSRIASALLQYSIYNAISGVNRYPCPARPDLAPTDANFGLSVLGCESGTPTGLTILSGGTEVIRGMVPVRTLAAYGIDDTDAYDAWNDRIMYVVNRQLTLGGTGTASSRPTVTEMNITTQTIVPPDFIVISYGRDKLGGIPKTMTSVSISCPSASTVLREENCDNDLVFDQAPSFTAPNANTTNSFDDILVYYRQ